MTRSAVHSWMQQRCVCVCQGHRPLSICPLVCGRSEQEEEKYGFGRWDLFLLQSLWVISTGFVYIFFPLQKPPFQNQVQASLVVLGSRGRSRSSTSPQRKEARSDVTSVILYLYPQLEIWIYILLCFLFFWAAVGRPLLWTLQQQHAIQHSFQWRPQRQW